MCFLRTNLFSLLPEYSYQIEKIYHWYNISIYSPYPNFVTCPFYFQCTGSSVGWYAACSCHIFLVFKSGTVCHSFSFTALTILDTMKVTLLRMLQLEALMSVLPSLVILIWSLIQGDNLVSLLYSYHFYLATNKQSLRHCETMQIFCFSLSSQPPNQFSLMISKCFFPSPTLPSRVLVTVAIEVSFRSASNRNPQVFA